MSFDKHTFVKRHIRDDKPVKRHLRRLKKDIKKVVDPTRDQFEIVEVDNIGVIEVPAEVFNQIEAGVTPPIQGLKSVGFNDIHLQELIELDGLSDKGEVIIRNATSGALKRVQLLNFQE